jgi:hypothetical protein
MLSQYSCTLCASGKIEATPMIATGVSRNPGLAGLLLSDVFDMVQNPSNLD